VRTMAKIWCECDKCDGGKLVGRATWYRHQKKTCTPNAYAHLPVPILAQRDLSLDSSAGPSTGIDVNQSEEVDVELWVPQGAQRAGAQGSALYYHICTLHLTCEDVC
jgi:hypothetical protein